MKKLMFLIVLIFVAPVMAVAEVTEVRNFFERQSFNLSGEMGYIPSNGVGGTFKLQKLVRLNKSVLYSGSLISRDYHIQYERIGYDYCGQINLGLEALLYFDAEKKKIKQGEVSLPMLFSIYSQDYTERNFIINYGSFGWHYKNVDKKIINNGLRLTFINMSAEGRFFYSELRFFSMLLDGAKMGKHGLRAFYDFVSPTLGLRLPLWKLFVIQNEACLSYSFHTKEVDCQDSDEKCNEIDSYDFFLKNTFSIEKLQGMNGIGIFYSYIFDKIGQNDESQNYQYHLVGVNFSY